METSEEGEWNIRLAWRQKVAAFWSISWPAWALSLILATWLMDRYSISELPDHIATISLVTNVAFFAIQAVLVLRLPRKNYRTFRIEVIRDNDERARRFLMREAARVWARIFWPQIVLIGLASVVALVSSSKTSAISSLMWLVQLLVIGPLAIAFALRA